MKPKSVYNESINDTRTGTATATATHIKCVYYTKHISIHYHTSKVYRVRYYFYSSMIYFLFVIVAAAAVGIILSHTLSLSLCIIRCLFHVFSIL